MKKLALTLAAIVLGATAASAQVEFRREGGGFDRGERTTVIRREGGDFDRGERTEIRRRGGDWDRGERTVIRRERRNVYATGAAGCRTMIIRRQNAMGDTVVKRIRKCG